MIEVCAIRGYFILLDISIHLLVLKSYNYILFKYYYPLYPPIAYIPCGKDTIENERRLCIILGIIYHFYLIKLYL